MCSEMGAREGWHVAWTVVFSPLLAVSVLLFACRRMARIVQRDLEFVSGRLEELEEELRDYGIEDSELGKADASI